MAPDHTHRKTHLFRHPFGLRFGPEPHRPDRTRPSGHVPGRPPRPIARALALISVHLALHLPTPWPSPTDPVSTPGGTATATALVSALPAPTPTAPPSPGITPTPVSAVPAPAGTPSAIPDAGVTTPAHGAQASGSSAPAATSTTPSSPGTPPLDPPPVRPADAPWVLRADRLVLRAAAFRGVVTVRSGAGTVEALKFTARSVDAVSFGMTAGKGRAVMRLGTRAGTTSTLEGHGGDNTVTLYLRVLSGTLTDLGGAPLPADRTVTVTPDSVPDWLADLASPARAITFVNVTVSPLTQSGAHLSIPGPLFQAGAR
ncbi:hypothetical protein [Streptomyces sp. MK5]|uniref:hypothetical protein n=1 Tax=Streptomyces sp. MK5 TaxID=3064253 RepID=UPI0027419476|nr:hypothetical protein [Streptomyces sp. MK5]